MPTGTYYVFSNGRVGSGTADDDYHDLYHEVYYPDSPGTTGATELMINGDMQNINLTLTRRYIRGTLTMAGTGQPISDHPIRLYNSDWEEIESTVSDHLENYCFGRLNPGGYYVGSLEGPFMPLILQSDLGADQCGSHRSPEYDRRHDDRFPLKRGDLFIWKDC